MSISLILLWLASLSVQQLSRAHELSLGVGNAYQWVTGDDSDGNRRHWDKFFSTKRYVYGKEPAEFLRSHLSFLKPGRALDLAMGEGRNSVYLAKMGFAVDGVDLSGVALRKARLLAHENQVTLNSVIADLTQYKIKPNYYSLIIEFDYLQRDLIPQIKRGLKRGGVIVFENGTVDQLINRKGDGLRQDLLLKKGELREFFKDFEILVYRETNDGKDAKASLIARKP